MRQVWFRKCSFARTTVDGRVTLSAWVPEKFAKLGEVVKFKDDDSWDEGWVVEFVGSRKTEREVELDGSEWMEPL